jgi:DNA-binding protein H-NS
MAIKPDMLESFNDDDVREIRGLCDKVLKSRDDDRKAKAMEQARMTLAAVGLTLKDLAGVKAKPAKGSSYKGGHSYQHPTNKALVWQAKGKKPKWLVELEADGERAIELPANDNIAAAAANDNFRAVSKREGGTAREVVNG